MSSTPEQRRSALGSLSSTSLSFDAAEESAAVPQRDPASEAIIERLLQRETIEKLESAGRYSRAKWKIQVWIKSDRSVHKPIAFTLSFWESGKRLHGGGDESAFICRRRTNAPRPAMPPFLALGGKSPFKNPVHADGCGSIIPGDIASGGFTVCPDCGMRWDTEHIGDSIFYRVPVETAAVVITEWFRRLNSDCDIFVKFRPEDVRVKMMGLEYGTHIAMQLKGLMIYPLARIIQDTTAGASLESRFKAMLLS